MTRSIAYGSLFTGIGGLDLGLERAGIGPCRWQVESDPHCRAVLAQRWPGVPLHDDARTVGRETLCPVDLICGGWPCQDLSVAGRGAGLHGARSGLYFEFARVVRELRPRFVVMENVAALAARGLDRVTADLSACGYDATWVPLRASDVRQLHEACTP